MLFTAMVILVSWTSLVAAFVIATDALRRRIRRSDLRERLLAVARREGRGLFFAPILHQEPMTIAEFRRARRRAHYAGELPAAGLLSLVAVDDYLDDDIIRDLIDEQTAATALQRELVMMHPGEGAVF